MVPSNEERIQQVVEELRSLAEDLADEGREQTGEAEAEAEQNIARYGEAREELDAAQREIVRLEAEREELPNRAYRAGMDEEYEEEDRLKERYKNLKPALEALRREVAELEEEIAELVGPNPTARPDLDCMIRGYSRVREAYAAAARPLIDLDEQVSRVLRETKDPLIAGQKMWGDTLRGIRDQRAGDRQVHADSLRKRGVRIVEI